MVRRKNDLAAVQLGGICMLQVGIFKEIAPDDG
jgi:hypothetical protein